MGITRGGATQKPAVFPYLRLQGDLMPSAYLQRIATAVPDYDIHEGFVEFAAGMLDDPRARSIFNRLAVKSDIRHRFSCLAREHDPTAFSADAMTFYGSGISRTTAERMRVFERCAPQLARRALDQLALSESERSRIRHVLVTCCTGFYAPGLDFDIIDHLGLPSSTERTFLGFMGCYAAINALKLARHIVRSQPDSAALVLNLELCTLHFHQTQELGEALAFLLFGDGCSAALVDADPTGFEMDSFHALRIESARDLITWRIGDLGFDMHLSTQVPNHIAKAMRENAASVTEGSAVDLWAIHPGGRAILDAVEDGLDLHPDTLAASRCILSRFGNMSSATVMFVLQRLMKEARAGQRGCAISFGPGLTAEIMRFHAV